MKTKAKQIAKLQRRVSRHDGRLEALARWCRRLEEGGNFVRSGPEGSDKLKSNLEVENDRLKKELTFTEQRLEASYDRDEEEEAADKQRLSRVVDQNIELEQENEQLKKGLTNKEEECDRVTGIASTLHANLESRENSIRELKANVGTHNQKMRMTVASRHDAERRLQETRKKLQLSEQDVCDVTYAMDKSICDLTQKLKAKDEALKRKPTNSAKVKSLNGLLAAGEQRIRKLEMLIVQHPAWEFRQVLEKLVAKKVRPCRLRLMAQKLLDEYPIPKKGRIE